eukprot:Protomagalhaensia_wolfi_Nauph_80__5869@NODE_752_length_2030_cov_111_282772_g565_i0_p1_GENE_NODE_752_length_2030_cov_111_282772_g565_i0NODE_752_length_2030_cov_111_282772_g565_i0_p1_ORF_typecomplete_len279_score58_61TPR_16/PF13432_6/2_1e08TPR_16/PF13432_6/5e06TPR_16/PF13432_6/0_12TPR_16/PF13432_6/9_8e09TPR_11/PF13414_6/1_9e05TPR_11/PF13414_6/6_9e05TPR_11/PF13414_6/0_24TPR_11/PF13414_6/0_058TPR_11/PF13414_6/39TPR_11/PF13414_6/0_0026TPR_9/PF13371_6/0_0086TPR_9/PF13371_6/0_0072TPR_9/PF13371_6/7_7e07
MPSETIQARTPSEEMGFLGDEYYRVRRYKQALECYRRAQELDPEEPLYVYKEAAVHLKELRLEEHEKALERAIECHEPATAKIRAEEHFEKAEHLCRLQKWSEALRTYEQAIAWNPVNPKYYKGRAEVFHSMDDCCSALAEVNRALELDSKDATLWDCKAYWHSELKEQAAAASAWSKAISLEPRNWRYRWKRRDAYMKLGQWRQALPDADWLVDLEPGQYTHWEQKGRCHYHLSEQNKAIDSFKKALELNPQSKTKGCIKLCQKNLLRSRTDIVIPI